MKGPGEPATALPSLPWILVASCCFGVFAASCSGTTRAPFLIDMARDLAVSVPLVANLMAVTSIAWGIASLLAGAGSARWGRRPFLVGGPLALAVSMTGVALSDGFLGVAVWATLGGGCSGLFTGVIYAEISTRVTDRQRGRALGWVMAGQSLTLLVGVPLAAWIGAAVGWRGVNICVAALSLVAALALLATSGRRKGDPMRHVARASGMAAALTFPVIRLLAMGIGERVCYGLTGVYFATFLQQTYDLSLAAVAVPLAAFALGNILGTLGGGQLADRLANRRLTFAWAMLASAGAALALFGWTPGVVTTVVLGFVYMFLNALARPAMMAALAEVPDEVRGAVMGLHVTGASIGWLGAASLGGIILSNGGFGGFGPLTAGVAVASAGLAVIGRR